MTVRAFYEIPKINREWRIRICRCGFPLGATLAAMKVLNCPDCGRRTVPVETETETVDVVER